MEILRKSDGDPIKILRIVKEVEGSMECEFQRGWAVTRAEEMAILEGEIRMLAQEEDFESLSLKGIRQKLAGRRAGGVR